MKVHRPNAQVIPHDLFNFLMPAVDNLSELKVIFFIAHQTAGRGKEWDWISESQFRNGIVRRRDREQINKGTGLTTPSIRRGIEKALEHEHILRRYTCRSCHNIVEKTETVERAYKTRHGEGATEIQEVPARCPHCQNKLRGNYCAEYSLNWKDEPEESTKETLVPPLKDETETTKRMLVPPLKDDLRPTKNLLVTEELTEERLQKNRTAATASPKPQTQPQPPKPDYLDLSAKTYAKQQKIKAPIKHLSELVCRLLGKAVVPTYRHERDWNEPLSELLAQAGGDVDVAAAALQAAVVQGRENELTLSSPASLYNMAVAALSDNGTQAKAEAEAEAMKRELAVRAKVKQLEKEYDDNSKKTPNATSTHRARATRQ